MFVEVAGGCDNHDFAVTAANFTESNSKQCIHFVGRGDAIGQPSSPEGVPLHPVVQIDHLRASTNQYTPRDKRKRARGEG